MADPQNIYYRLYTGWCKSRLTVLFSFLQDTQCVISNSKNVSMLRADTLNTYETNRVSFVLEYSHCSNKW